MVTTHKDTKDIICFSIAGLNRWTGKDDTQPLQRCGMKIDYFG